MSNVQLGYTQVIDPISFKSIPSGKIYIGEYGTLPNPANAGTWKQAYFVNSDGTRTAASQPIATNAAGYAVDGSGNIKSVQVDGQYSVLVQSASGATKFSAAKAAPLASSDQVDAGGGRTQADKNAEIVSVLDFGAKGDGVTDDTSAINNALVAVNAMGAVTLYFPAGTYLYQGNGWLGNGVVIVGDGRNATTIRSTLPSPNGGHLFRCLGYGSGIRSMRFDALGTTQTGGSYVWLSAPESFIDDFFMTGDFNGIWMTGNVSRIRHGRFQDGAVGAIRIKAEGGDNSQLIDDVLMGAQSPQVSAAGIRVRNSSALIISNTSVIQQGHALLIDPYSNTTGSNTVDTDSGSVFSLYVNNCFFDNSNGNAIRITPTGNANVVRCRFDNVWASSSSGDGVFISNASSGIVSGMHFVSPHVVLNGGSGFALGGTLSDISINGGEICQNVYGLYVTNTVTKLTVTNATIGLGAGLSGNTSYGVAFDAGASASSDIIIVNNQMKGNGLGAISPTLPSGSSIHIYGNIGAATNPWTPTLTFATPGNLNVTYSARSGSYCRVGNMVTVSFVIATSSFTWTTSSGALQITGLPFTTSSTVQVATGAVEFQGITKAGYSNFNLNLAAASNAITVRASNSASVIAAVVAADVPSGGTVTLRGSITYLVD